MTTVKTKPRDVQVFPLGKDTMAFRSRSWDRLRFEIEYGLQRGTTANSYLIRGDKTALLDPPGESFTELYLKELQKRFDLHTLDYLILSHTNPNRIETLKALLSLIPSIRILCTNPAAQTLKSDFADRELNLGIIRGEEQLDLGQEHHLTFIPTPTPTWPDHLCSFDAKTRILFTDKLFGCHRCGDQVYDEGWTQFVEDRRYYYDCLMASQSRQVETALERLEPFDAAFYAPNHGPMVRDGLRALKQQYQTLTQERRVKDLQVALLYASAYGNTATLGRAIAHGIGKANVQVDIINCEVADPADIKEAVETADGVIIGSPTLGGHVPTQIQTAFGILLSNAHKGQTVGVFGSFGWSGEAIDHLADKLREAGFTFGFEPIRVKFKPTEATLQTCAESGLSFAQILKRARKSRQLTQSPITPTDAGNRTEQSLGRIVGPSSVITAKRGEATGALLTSWVSQATFNPPGFTVAVAKDHPIESLLYVGDPFVINVLQEGESQLQKHFAKSFAPGEDRFAGLEVTDSENGSLILQGALAYMECEVSSRMDCGDHWVLYAVSKQGKVLQTNGRTALRHRKVGNFY